MPPLTYSQFKKQLLPTLDRKLLEIGFGRDQNRTPTYWRRPHSDERLVWVVCLNFSRLNNVQFDILMGPYWMSCAAEAATPFPECVGYRGYLSPRGYSDSQYWWKATPQVIEVVVSALAGPGLEWFSKCGTPEDLLRLEPSATLAIDLGQWADARRLLFLELEQQFADRLSESSAAKEAAANGIDLVARTSDRLRDVAQRSNNVDELDREIRECEIRACRSQLELFRKQLITAPKSCWLAGRVQASEQRLGELHAT